MEDKVIYTLIFVKTSDKLLLGYKKRGFGANTWNGYGGKVEHDENILDGAIRELHEESNLKVCREDLNYLGFVTYKTFGDKCQRIVYIFTTQNVKGILQETEEMKPNWFCIEDIPYSKMLPDAQYWLHLVVQDSKLNAEFTYCNGLIVEHHVEEVQELLPLPFVTNRSQGV